MANEKALSLETDNVKTDDEQGEIVRLDVARLLKISKSLKIMGEKVISEVKNELSEIKDYYEEAQSIIGDLNATPKGDTK
jgi:hypothetical protein